MSMAEQLNQVRDKGAQMYRDHGPSQRQVVGLLSIATAGVTLLLLGLATAAVVAVGLAVSTPVILLFSPVLVPILLLLALGSGALLTCGGFGVVSVSALSWVYNYYKGRHPLGSDQIDAARSRLLDTAAILKERARDYSHNVQDYLHSSKEQVAAPGA